MKLVKLYSAIVITMFVMNSQVFAQNTYFEFGNLNSGSVSAGAPWVKLNTGTHLFTKNQNDTDIEIYVNSRFTVGDFPTPGGVRIWVRIDDEFWPDYGNEGSFRTPNTQEFQSILAVYQNIPAGTHSVSIWAKCTSGLATGILADPGGWFGKIIVKIVNDAASTTISENPVVPNESFLQQNYPNPFYPETTIEYSVQQSSQVELNIYNNMGQLVKNLVNDYKTTGEYSVVWDCKDNLGQAMPSGNYLYQIRVGEFISSKKMILIK